MTDHSIYMRRCLELAQLGAGNTAPNPMVGAVLVYEGRIIGEGWHEEYGNSHAEVNCINSVSSEDIQYIEKSTIYISLEPCSHFGKTPPCADLIIRSKIPEVIIGCSDSFEKVNGGGIEKLNTAAIKTEVEILEVECRDLNRRFFTYHEKKRPYIILKWAETYNGKISGPAGTQIQISNEVTNKLVHKWRTEEAAILVGTNTALSDDPALTARHWSGKNPVRILLDDKLKVPSHAKIFNEESKTIIINKLENKTDGSNVFYKAERGVEGLLNILYKQEIISVIVEGGSKTLQMFIDAGVWDEARVITNIALQAGEGIDAPSFNGGILVKEEMIFTDRIRFYMNQ